MKFDLQPVVEFGWPTCAGRAEEVDHDQKFRPPQNNQSEQGNYSLRRPPKLIIPQIFIEQRRATVYSFMCKQICISNKANMTRA